MEDCRGYIETCLLNGEKIQYVYEEHCRKAILDELRALSENTVTSEKQFVNEPGDMQVMLCVIPEDEKIEKGMYRYNKPDAELLLCAPPALMAMLLGEYKLAQKICELAPRQYENDTAFEVLQDNKGPILRGSEFRFCEVCLLGCDMNIEDTGYFLEKGMFDFSLYCNYDYSFFAKVVLHGNPKQAWKYILRMMERIREQADIDENFRNYILLLICYAIIKKVDIGNGDFWKDIFRLYSEKEERKDVIEFAHKTLLQKVDVIHDVVSKEYRILPFIEAYFCNEDCLLMNDYVRRYVEYIIGYSDVWKEKEFRNYCKIYFSAVKRFGGEETEEWWEMMLDLFEKKDVTLIELGFQNHFLKEDWIAEYIDYFISQKEYTWIVPYLIQKNWLIKENANGNVQ